MSNQGRKDRGWRKPRASSEVLLTARKIYVLPTKAGFGLLLALIVMLLAAINYQNSMAYGLTFLLASLALLSLLHTWRNLWQLQLLPAGVSHCFVKQPASFQIKLLNSPRGAERLALGIGWQGAQPQWLDLAKGAEQVVQLHLVGQRRGRLAAPSIRLVSTYPLGIWQAWSHFQLKQSALVYPEPLALPLASQVAGEQQDQQANQARQAGVDDYEGLRQWQAGESLRRINWKAWSRGQGLLVKEFNQLTGSQQQLDFASLSGDVEQRLSVLTHHVLALTEQQQSFSLHLPQTSIGPGQGLGHLQACLRALALVGEGDV
ncbi:DUF58 domain-containing protein [Thiopseudomonas alkaliphila]|uniref:DUF58 domain-containing protein n=1 Tax=Thiopseudomonas alkaliphila TaxID=1697053 RepID=UPI002574F064|nr:DUF58 domain-containing protein [Thiopseudomonas alkaliphila]MDM1707780.1 DUF58 domain-containing protein [Thiopseudomonas alkaliphila]